MIGVRCRAAISNRPIQVLLNEWVFGDWTSIEAVRCGS